MKKNLLFFVTILLLFSKLNAQEVCTATGFEFDLSASIDTTVSIQSTRSGSCCNGSNCIVFKLKLNPACSYVNFTVANPAPPGNAAFYQVDCGPQTSLGTPLCIVGKTEITITFCKPGNDNPIYTIVAAGAIKGSDDITVRQGCTGSLNVGGLLTESIKWTSVYPGPQGAYNSFLSSTSGSITTNVTPLPGAPAYIDYQVSGNRLCGPVVSDTIRVYTTPQIAVAISADNPAVCAGGKSNVTLTATASGGVEPYQFVWSNGQTGESITVNAGGTYTVSVTDALNCLPAVQSTIVATTPLPPAPSVNTNSPVCESSQINLFASTIAGATYNWTGPNGFTSSLQNPVINNADATHAGTYTVVVTVGQCSSLPVSTSVTVKPKPASPVAASTNPVCEGTTLTLTASALPGGVYSWTGPNGFISSLQNPVISSAVLTSAGTYAVTVQVNGCTSEPASVTTVVNPLPPAPVIGSNSPLCSGKDILLTAGTISEATYSWTGPNGFTSPLQNPIISNVATNASGTYNVRTTVAGCTGPAASTSVIVNPIPAAPVLSSNGPLCEGATLLLTASTITGATYAWSGPDGFSATVQNPSVSNPGTAASGAYSSTATVNGCTSPAGSVQVTIKPVPASPVLSGDNTVCEGSTISLNASTITGATYAWSGPNGFTSSLQTLTILNTTPLHSGIYSVRATVDGCTSQAAISNITITPLPLPPAVTSNSPVCSGNTISLTASPLAGAIYNWTGPDGFTSTLQNPQLSGATLKNAGNYQLSVSVNGCASASSTATNVIVHQTPEAPVVSNNGPICEGTTLTLTASALPGGVYSWTGPNGFQSSTQSPSIGTASLQSAGAYSLTVTANGCTSAATSTTAVVHALPAAPVIGTNSPICSGNTLSLIANTIPDASYAWTGPDGFTSSIQNPVLTNAGIATSGVYTVKAAVNGCWGPSASIRVTVNAIPSAPVVSYNGPVCEGTNLSLFASTVIGATYSWTGPNGFTSTAQNPAINNAHVTSSGSYAVTATVNGCTSAPGNLTVTVNTIPAPPVVTSDYSLCEGSALQLQASAITGATYAWSGPDGFVSTAQNPTIASTRLTHSGTYAVAATVNGCTSPLATSNVVIKSLPVAPVVSSNSPVCSGKPILLNAAAVAGATYTWSGPKGFTSSLQNPVIENASLAAIGQYSLSVSVNNCSSTETSSVTILVNQTPDAPVPTHNGPVCENTSLTLAATDITGASYSWNGPNGYTASTQTATLANVTNANAGTYVVTATVKGCTSTAASTTVAVHNPAIVNAGTNQSFCTSSQFTGLSGSITGGTSTGVWTTNGSGTFLPDNVSLNARYHPSVADKAAGSVTLSLASTNNGACPVYTSAMTITMASPPTVVAGKDQLVCANNATVRLQGKLTVADKAIWSSSGNGQFSPSASSLDATYIPSSSDKANGAVMLSLTTVGNGPCAATTDAMMVSIKAPPVITAERVKYIVEDNSTLLNPSVSGRNLKCTWTPALYLNADTIVNPLCTPKSDVSYKLVAVDEFGCTASADIMAKIIRRPEVPNVFTPNGDGINDRWQIKHLINYPDCTVEIYNRYGQVVYQGVGYSAAWDGTSKGQPLPAATYYYIIHPKNGLKPLSGFVDIVR
ncbi:gliding motility-associated C-terminal domain-containing protein [Flavisolibacter sp. BT320]|nr:gliding motility-associated C-terminal domain-containing protein [Flavisolibacter longurius]